jgi:hypothetical protein
MALRDWISQPIVTIEEQPPERGEPVAAAKKRQVQEREGVFVTEKSILTFPVMSGIIIAAWTIYEKGSQTPHSLTPGIIVSLIAGAFLFFANETDPKKRNGPRLIRVGVAVANTIVLFGAASGYYAWAH